MSIETKNIGQYLSYVAAIVVLTIVVPIFLIAKLKISAWVMVLLVLLCYDLARLPARHFGIMDDDDPDEKSSD